MLTAGKSAQSFTKASRKRWLTNGAQLPCNISTHKKQPKEAGMTDQEIIDLFDSSDITLKRLSEISNRSVAELKQILMGA